MRRTYPSALTTPRAYPASGLRIGVSYGNRLQWQPGDQALSAGGFTLIELLVVMAIVAILATLVLPALIQARAGAGTAFCAGNLRQFGVAAQMYWDDHDGAAFPYRGTATPNGDFFWFGWLERGEEGQRRFDPTRGMLWPYLASRAVHLCPALKQHQPDFKPKAGEATGGYGYNLTLSSTPEKPSIRVTSLLGPAELVSFADAAQVNDFQAPASPEHPMLEEFYYVNHREPTVHFRHAMRATVSFVDGHVTREPPTPGSLDSRLPQASVGRLRNSILLLP